jgi:hypothetical protein
MDGHGLDFSLMQLIHLVLHQGDQGSNDNADPFHGHGAYLEGNGFASTRGHQGQGILSLEYGKDDFFLQGTEFFMAPESGQDLQNFLAISPKLFFCNFATFKFNQIIIQCHSPRIK